MSVDGVKSVRSHALISGGSRGIGAAIAETLLEAGYRVSVTGRDTDALQAFALEHAAHADRLFVTAMDVSERTSVDGAMRQARAAFGPIAVLVNNAGQAHSAPFLKTEPDLWQRLFDVNVAGVVHCTQAALPDMLEAGWGRIVNIASTAGLKGYAYVSAYVASKHAVIGLTRSLALELATKGVTVNAVCPGYTETDLVLEAVRNIMAKTGRTGEQALAELARGNPQGRLVQPQEVADAVRWLVSDSATSITGQSIAVAGGEI